MSSDDIIPRRERASSRAGSPGLIITKSCGRCHTRGLLPGSTSHRVYGTVCVTCKEEMAAKRKAAAA